MLVVGLTSAVQAGQNVSAPAISGYDTVAFFDMNEAVRGSGFHVANHNSHTSLFSTKENKEK